MKKMIAMFGPPGTGKTTSLVDMCCKIPDHWTNNLFLSFTKAAAAEAVSRLSDDIPVKASTLHSLAFGMAGMASGSVVDTRKMLQFSHMSGFPFKGSEPGSEELQEGDEYVAVMSYANNTESEIHDAWDYQGRPGSYERLQMFIKSYVSWKREFGYVDFDDMLKSAAAIDSVVPRGMVMLDEAQDCSKLQWRLFNRIIAETKCVVIAGDDDQAIYEWNGASPHGMIEQATLHNGEVRVLSTSYRLPKAVFKVVTGLSAMIGTRVPKTWGPAPDAPDGSVTRYGDVDDVDFSVIDRTGGALVLVRDRFRLTELKQSLNRQMIPYEVYGGHSPWTSKIGNAIRQAGCVPAGTIVPIHWQEFYNQALRTGSMLLPVNITLSTVHQAKGREHNRVIVDLQMSPRTLLGIHTHRDAELRVMYVACSRAKKELLLCGTNPLI